MSRPCPLPSSRILRLPSRVTGSPIVRFADYRLEVFAPRPGSHVRCFVLDPICQSLCAGVFLPSFPIPDFIDNPKIRELAFRTEGVSEYYPQAVFERAYLTVCLHRRCTRSINYVWLWVLALFLATASTAFAIDSTLESQAKISKLAAEKIALSKVPTGTIQSAELEKERGKLIWSFDISKPRTKNITEVQVDARNGRIVSVQIETPAAQTKEGKSDA